MAYDSNVVLLLHLDGVDGSTVFTDGSFSHHQFTASGDAQIDTEQAVFGQSALFDGNDRISCPGSTDFTLGALGSGNNWTVDFRVRWNGSLSDTIFLSTYKQYSFYDSWSIYFVNSGGGYLKMDFPTAPGVDALAWTPSVDTWYHVAIVKNGTIITAYIDGISIGTFQDANMEGSSQPLNIGDSAAGSFGLNGWLDEIRIVKGIAVWTANFTPPTQPYTDPSVPGKSFNIPHTRLKYGARIIDTKLDRYNSMTVIVEIDPSIPSGYYLDLDVVPFAVYLDRKFYSEFFGKEVKIQLEEVGVASIIEAYALPNPGFRKERGHIENGNKLRIRFSAKRGDMFDITKHILYYDNATGTFESKAIGIVDALTAEAGGRLINRGRFLTKSELLALYR